MTQTPDQLLHWATDQLVSLQARLEATYAAIDRSSKSGHTRGGEALRLKLPPRQRVCAGWP